MRSETDRNMWTDNCATVWISPRFNKGETSLTSIQAKNYLENRSLIYILHDENMSLKEVIFVNMKGSYKGHRYSYVNIITTTKHASPFKIIPQNDD